MTRDVPGVVLHDVKHVVTRGLEHQTARAALVRLLHRRLTGMVYLSETDSISPQT